MDSKLNDAVKDRVKVFVNLREYAILTILRKIQFGSLEIYKENGQIERIVIKENKRISESDGFEEVVKELSSIAIVGESSILKREEASVTYG